MKTYKKYLRIVALNKLIVAFVLIATIGGMLFARITPLFWGADEPAHFARVYALSNGNSDYYTGTIDGKKVVGVHMPTSIVNTIYHATKDVTDAPVPGTLITDKNVYSEAKSTSANSESKLLGGVGGTGIYPVFSYIAPIIGIGIAKFMDGSVDALVVAGRIVNLLQYIVITAAALYLVRKSHMRWIVFVVALLPMTLFQAAIINPDSLNFSLSFLVTAATVNIFQRKTANWKILAAFAAICILFVITKPVLWPLLLVLPILGFRQFPKQKRIFTIVGIPAIALMAGLLWMLFASSHIVNSEGVSTVSGQVQYIISHPYKYLRAIVATMELEDWIAQLTGSFGSNFVKSPVAIKYLLFAILSIIPFVGIKHNMYKLKTWQSVAVIGVGVATIGAIVTVLYLTWNSVGAEAIGGVQARYFIPVIPILLFGLSAAVQDRVRFKESTLIGGLSILMAFCLATSMYWYNAIVY